MNWFKHGWKLKLISLGLAMGLWYYALNEESVEITRTIPIRVVVENKNMSLLKVSSNTLRVVMKVPRAMVGEVASSDIHLRHSFGKELKQAGEYSFRVDAREIALPGMGLHVIKMDPQVVQVSVDELVIQKLPVKPRFLGEPAFGYKIREDEIQMDPNAVMAQGPKGEIGKMNAILTRPISLTGRTRSFRISTELDLPPFVHVSAAKMVDLYIPIHEVSEEKELEDVTIKMLRASGALGIAELNPAKISILIQGPRRVLENLTAEKMHAYADLSAMDYGEQDVDIAWVLPPGVTIKKAGQRFKVKALIRREAA